MTTTEVSKKIRTRKATAETRSTFKFTQTKLEQSLFYKGNGKARWKEQGRFKCTMKPIDKNVIWMNAEINPMELIHKVDDVYTLKNKLRQWQIFLNKISKHTEVHEEKNGAILTVQVLEQDIEKYKKLGFVEDDEAGK